MSKPAPSPTEAAHTAQLEAIAALPPKERGEIKACVRALREVAEFWGVDVAVEALRLVTLENELEAEF